MSWVGFIVGILVWSALALFIGRIIGNAIWKREVQAQKSFYRKLRKDK